MAKVKINNIVSVTHNSTAQPGIISAEININKGQHIPNLDEGVLYPTGVDNVGTAEFPVTGSLTLEDMSTVVSLLAAAAATLVITGKAHGANANKIYTISNAFFTDDRASLQRQRDGQVTINFAAYAATGGTTLPIAVTDAGG